LGFAGITVPGGFRYHPAVIAQGLATLGQMFPGRLPWFALGAGEALNESVTGQPWPSEPERYARLQEAAFIVRELLDGRVVTEAGRLHVANARIWSRPRVRTQLIGAALTAKSAARVAVWAEGLLTIGTNLQSLTANVEAFRECAGPRPIHAKLDLSWAATEDEAVLQAMSQWRVQALDRAALHDLETPEAFASAARLVQPEEITGTVLISSDLSQHTRWLEERAAIGLASLDLHNVGRNQMQFIEAFGAEVLPALRAARPPARLWPP
jgi:G6PDH family F420-dependent oxidoreductase